MNERAPATPIWPGPVNEKRRLGSEGGPERDAVQEVITPIAYAARTTRPGVGRSRA